MRKHLLAAVAVLALGPRAFAAEASSSDTRAIKTLIETAVNGTIDVLKDKANDREARRKKIFALIDPVVDFQLMGKLTLGRAHWGQFNEAQQKEFTESFRRVIRDFVFDKVEVYTNETSEFEEPVPTEKGKYQLMMHVIRRGERYNGLFKLYHADAGWKVYDLEIQGISLVRIYAAQYDQVLQKGTPKDLLAKLKAKALATPEEINSPGKPKSEGK